MSQGTNISGISRANNPQTGATVLPIRSEKVVMTGASTADDYLPPGDAAATTGDYHVVAAKLSKYNQYVAVRIKGRSSTLGAWSGDQVSTYRFLINPATVGITRQTVDEQSQTRAGWQIGVWGEDFITINLTGKTPGRYFSHGLSAFFTEWTESYRNLMALEMLFENNGCWFEGEQVTGVLGSVTKRIKYHQDVELIVGEFIWRGMFESMSINEHANAPYLADFTLVFTAWHEEFDTRTPYNMPPLGSEVQKGHVPPITIPAAPAEAYTTTIVYGSEQQAPATNTALTGNFWNDLNVGFPLPALPVYTPPSASSVTP